MRRIKFVHSGVGNALKMRFAPTIKTCHMQNSGDRPDLSKRTAKAGYAKDE
jgi:hypothetical protein